MEHHIAWRRESSSAGDAVSLGPGLCCLRSRPSLGSVLYCPMTVHPIPSCPIPRHGTFSRCISSHPIPSPRSHRIASHPVPSHLVSSRPVSSLGYPGINITRLPYRVEVLWAPYRQQRPQILSTPWASPQAALLPRSSKHGPYTGVKTPPSPSQLHRPSSVPRSPGQLDATSPSS